MARDAPFEAGAGSDLEIALADLDGTFPAEIAVLVGPDGNVEPVREDSLRGA